MKDHACVRWEESGWVVARASDCPSQPENEIRAALISLIWLADSYFHGYLINSLVSKMLENSERFASQCLRPQVDAHT